MATVSQLWENRTQQQKGDMFLRFLLCLFLRTISSPNMMPAAEGMTHMIPNHVLRVGQTIRLDSTPETAGQHDDCGHHDLDISLENLNRIILELDPTFEPIQVDKSPPEGRALPQNLCENTFFCHFSVSGLCYIKRLTMCKQLQPLLCSGVMCYTVKPHSPDAESS